ncbi:hypothetical protein GQX74_007487 [Glossina fuscipes]|nr:hypothetical protein GQX74_007487 [Glossina fuscipes]
MQCGGVNVSNEYKITNLSILLFNALQIYKALIYFIHTPQSPHTQTAISCFKKFVKQTQSFEPFDVNKPDTKFTHEIQFLRHKVLINTLEHLGTQAILTYLSYEIHDFGDLINQSYQN